MGHGLSSSIECCQQEPLQRSDNEFKPDALAFRVTGMEESPPDRVRPLKLNLRHWNGPSPSSSFQYETPTIEVDGGAGCSCFIKVDSTTCNGLPSPKHLSEPIKMQSLSYNPTQFEECSTEDTDRSQGRYSNTSVLSCRIKTRKQMQHQEAWVQSAVEGRPVILVLHNSSEVRAGMSGMSAKGDPVPHLRKVHAKYVLDRSHAALSILPQGRIDIDSVVVYMEAIRVISSVPESVLFMAQWGSSLSRMEQNCGVIMQYCCEDETSGVKEICFLEESEAAKDTFIEGLTALWLQEPQKHSLWY
eukprot:TRINITY_DN41983_c0_g1_i1.p1 TRINITY_DN41983_c0_g1~~TRINITY_DN41983_c0_g1_i1.p1  ORF type:complete len:309 (-),score=38.12 TRINITY_DN41983_c0_g1_i1:230-1135(-)